MTIQVQVTPLAGEQTVDDVLATAGIDPGTGRAVDRWRRSGGVQERVVLTAEQDGSALGAAMLVSRPGTASSTLNGWLSCGDAAARTLDALLAAAEDAAWGRGSILLKVAVDADDDLSPSVLTDRGFTALPDPHVPSPFPHDSADIPRGFVRHREGTPVPTMGYMRQTTEFTCGPVAVSMGMAHLGLAPAPDRATEIGLWREATLIGACDPYGLALATATRAVPTRVVISTRGPILLEDVTQNASTTELRSAIQADFAVRAVEAGVEVEHRRFAVEEIGRLVAAGAVVTVLIDQSPMHADADPHWIVVHGALGEVLLANDPWTDEYLGETWVDGTDVAIPPDLMDRLAGYGDPRYRAMVVLG
ncbi:peptidase C39 family protein [Actinotalea sp.]|uniref:peptidase C39 family protein n=1 Tax=Actinotalea sp. TaxID=1872145 RepID=UPI0035675FE1